MSGGFFNACMLFMSFCVFIVLPIHYFCTLLGVEGITEPQMLTAAVAIAAVFAGLAYRKGKSFFKWFIVSLFFFLPAWVYIVLLMSKTEKVSYGDLIQAASNMRDLKRQPGKDFKDFKDI